MEAAYINSQGHSYKAEDWQTDEWESIKVLDKNAAKSSGVEIEHLRDIGLKISTLPGDMEFHKQIKKIFDARVKSYKTG